MFFKNIYTFENVDPIIKIYCKKRQRIWFKKISDNSKFIKNSDTYIIYTKDNKEKIISCFDYFGPDLLNIPCDSIECASKMRFNYNETEFYFYIRGHIRNSFETDRLKNFVTLLKIYFPNIIFIFQTWKKKQCKNNESWRNIDENDNIVTKSTINNYFRDANITKNCIIIDDKTIKLVGSTNGNICLSKAPKIGWKNMWYGIYKGLENLDNIIDDKILVSFRYDYFDIIQSKNINETNIIKFIENNLNNNNINFIQYNTCGTDNCYMGNFKKMKALIERFHFKMDEILNANKKIYFQEFLVNIIAKQIEN
tara:strand:+ start:240 stop:1169 length:930 start_codon:yes stop_codon:yes gene_type:complete